MPIQTIISLTPTPLPFFVETGGSISPEVSLSLRDISLLLFFAIIGVLIVVWAVLSIVRSFTAKEKGRKKSRV